MKNNVGTYIPLTQTSPEIPCDGHNSAINHLRTSPKSTNSKMKKLTSRKDDRKDDASRSSPLSLYTGKCKTRERVGWGEPGFLVSYMRLHRAYYILRARAHASIYSALQDIIYQARENEPRRVSLYVHTLVTRRLINRCAHA